MSIELTVYADANARAVAGAPALLGELGPVYLLPYSTPGVSAPPMGLLAVSDDAGYCLDRLATFGEPDHALPAAWSGEPHPGLPEGVWGKWRDRDGKVWERATTLMMNGRGCSRRPGRARPHTSGCSHMGGTPGRSCGSAI